MDLADSEVDDDGYFIRRAILCWAVSKFFISTIPCSLRQHIYYKYHPIESSRPTPLNMAATRHVWLLRFRFILTKAKIKFCSDASHLAGFQ